MSLRKSFELALSNIMFDKVRSFLTMLGIIVGVAAVIILISLMNGMTGMITDTFNEMGTTTLTVTVQDRGGSRKVEEDDIYISTQTACSTGTKSIAVYEVTKNDEYAKHSVRVSLSHLTTKNEIDIFLEKLNQKIEGLEKLNESN